MPPGNEVAGMRMGENVQLIFQHCPDRPPADLDRLQARFQHCRQIAIGRREGPAIARRPVPTALVNGGIDGGGAQDGHADAPFGQIVGQRLGQADDAEFRRGVDAVSPARHDLMPADGGGIDDVAPIAMGQDQGQEGLEPVDDPHQVDAEHPVPVAVRHPVERHTGVADAGVVAEDVNGRKGRRDLLRRSLHRRPVGDVDGKAADLDAVAGQTVPDLKIRVTPYRGGGAVAAAVNSKRAEIGISDIGEMTDALTGSGRFNDRKHPNRRIAFRVLSFPVTIFVRKDSPIKTLKDMKGKKFGSRWSAFPNMIPLMNGLLATAGLSLNDIDGVPTANIIRGANDLKASKTDAFGFAVGAPKVAEVNSAVGGVRALGIDNSPAGIARMKSVRKDYFPMMVKPHPRMVGVLKPTWVLGSDLIIYVGAHVSDDTIYKFVEALHPDRKELAQGHPSFFGFQPRNMGKQFSVAKYHPGAIRFYKEKGIWPAK